MADKKEGSILQPTASISDGNFEPDSSHNGELKRNFKARHIQMITLGGCIGSGIFLSTGKALNQGGVGAMFIGFFLVCSMALSLMNVLTEMTCLYPTPGSFIDHATRFVDPSLGFALGFIEWASWMTITATEGSVVRLVLSYWTDAIPTWACMTVYLAIILALHSLPNTWFAEFEFVTSSFKVVALFIILFASLAMIGGAGPTGGVPDMSNFKSAAVAFPNGFKGQCSSFLLAMWAVGGQEIMGIISGEAQRPRWDMPRACKNLFFRLAIFYGLTVTCIAILVRYDDSRLLGLGNAASSPFVIAMNDAGIKGLPDLLNAIILVGLVAIGAESIYVASRVMTAMAKMDHFPKMLGRVDKKGRPYVALVVTAVCATTCTYINCSSTGGVIFTWFSSVSSVVFFITWAAIGITNIQMRRALAAQNDPAWSLPHAWKLRAFPASALFLTVSCILVLILTAYVSASPIEGPPSAETFFQTCLALPLFLVVWAAHKIIYRTKFVNVRDADLQTGRLFLSAEEIGWFDEYFAQPRRKRLLTYVTM